ncbi:uncharacterized protein LOC119075268 [Bradysia coprophila]|uniref:uncharacterized protein LOC119075268 n=1 Tax=Bradysia coprophila TaxID=38358 RepID=UPI00187D7C7A|nr:uncharacterized protein LOC119075268 [Bradysia coprophila]
MRSKVVNIIFIFAVAVGIADAYLRLDNESELREAQAALFNTNSESGWLLLNYVSDSTVHFAAGGEGGPDDVVPHLEADQIQYVLIRVGGIQEEGTSKTTYRDVFIAWIGPSVGIIEKGKKTAFLGDAQNMLQPFHASITALNSDKINKENIIDRSNPLSGSQVIE